MKRQPDLSMGWWDRDLESAMLAGTAPLWAKTYGRRDLILRSLGFDSYGEYLKSELWREIREAFFRERPRRRCWVCKRRRKATQIHHKIYTRNNLAGVNHHRMVPICGLCHRFIEFSRNSEKLEMWEVQRKLKGLRAWKQWPKIVRRIEARIRRENQ